MGILTRYIFRGTMLNVTYLVTISVSLIWIISTIQYVRLLINHPVSLLSVLHLTLLLIPGILVYVIPFTFSVGAALFYKQFDDTNELGILPMLGMKRLYQPIFFCGVTLTIIQAFAQMITPAATKDFFVREAIIRKQISLKIFQPNQFNIYDGATIFFQRMNGLTIYDLFMSYKNSFISAQSARLEYDENIGYRLIIHNGVTIDQSSSQKTRISFDTMTYDVGNIMPKARKGYVLMSKTMRELYNDHSADSRYEFISRILRMSVPMISTGILYGFLFVFPVNAPFMWASIGTSLFSAIFMISGKALVRFIP